MASRHDQHQSGPYQRNHKANAADSAHCQQRGVAGFLKKSGFRTGFNAIPPGDAQHFADRHPHRSDSSNPSSLHNPILPLENASGFSCSQPVRCHMTNGRIQTLRMAQFTCGKFFLVYPAGAFHHKKSSEKPYSSSSLLQSITTGYLTYHHRHLITASS